MSFVYLGCVLVLFGGVPDRDTSPIQLNHCVVEYKQSTKLGMPAMVGGGVLQSVLVQRGDMVKAGQVLANMPCNEEIVDVELTTAIAASDVAVRLAKVQHKQAEARFNISDKLYHKNVLSWEQYSLDRWTADAAAVTVEQALENRRIALLTMQRAKARLATRQIIAPHDGIISELLCKQGEAINTAQPYVLQIDDTSALRIAGKLDLRDAFRLRLGTKAKVKLDTITQDTVPITDLGTVIYIDTKIDTKSQTRLVIVELPNRALATLAGLETTLIFDSVESDQVELPQREAIR